MSSESSGSWTSDIEYILHAISKNSSLLSKEHKKRYFKLQKLLRYFKLPVIVFSSINAVFSVSLSTFITQDRVSLLCSFISLITTIITSIELYLQIEKQMSLELDSSKSYQILVVEIQKVLILNRENRTIDSGPFLDKCIADYQKLYDSSCIIEKQIKDNLMNIYNPEPINFKISNDELDVEINGE